MGEHKVEQGQDERRAGAFMKALLNDLAALERMLDEGRIETGVRRIGAEQEMFLVDPSMGPAPLATEVISRISDPRLTTEIARFNLEANLTPRTLAADCFRRLEQEINEVIGIVRGAARALGADVLLAGILPTLQRRDLTLDSITPVPRYYELNEAVMQQRGGDVSVHMKGLDEIHLSSDNIMPLSSNASFQVHLQVGPEEFVPMYNAAQAITAPVLAAAVNSPVWLGSRLWQETRLALFQHSADPRTRAEQERQNPTRVGFGERWLTDSVLELFREDVARFRVILTNEPDEDSLEVVARGGVPRLKALSLHNGTVWWWNRPCYGVGEGRAHLRIENRVLPSGPTPLDETANAAFFIGLMVAFPGEYGDIGKAMSFDDAKANLWAAARHGLKAQFSWAGGKTQAAGALILEHFLPLAREGLKAYAVDSSDVDRYLGTIEERVRTRQTGAQWALRSLASAGGASGEHSMRALAAAMHANQQTGEPVHRWPPACETGGRDWAEGYRTVGQFMTTDLFTVRPDDLVDLAASVMDWKHVRHVPVEDGEGRLVGLVSHRDILRLLARGMPAGGDEPVLVSAIMKAEPVTAAPDTPTLEAIDLMRSRKVGCLPVVENGVLVGIVTAQDFLAASARLFEERLGPRESPAPSGNIVGEEL
ncbi:MAG TPA: glutamate-cysteine ligase family protein [Pyrinomonadaceae bacterium]|jgi:CBS domain-containing protein/gamma-glutamyl:cysteine ligase YbdK (ATP-grasp superfamily)|nr:glutamate-cysteine ligase family protein [Pyrinomonadaceae bacterium]